MEKYKYDKIKGLQNGLYVNDKVVSHYVMDYEPIKYSPYVMDYDPVKDRFYVTAALITEDSRWLGTITFSPHTKESRIRWCDELIHLVPNVDICEVEKQIRENEKDSFWGKFIGG